jgi:hypothetical protein
MSITFQKTVTISEQEYKTLIDRDRWLSALESAGVDNWEGIEEAMNIRDQWDKENEVES